VLFGMLVRSPDAMQGVGFIMIFPLSFMAGTSCRSPAWR
jgi:ABC-2 type transport system permease protein